MRIRLAKYPEMDRALIDRNDVLSWFQLLKGERKRIVEKRSLYIFKLWNVFFIWMIKYER